MDWWGWRDAEQVGTSAAVFEHDQGVDAVEVDGVDVQEVDGDDVFGLAARNCLQLGPERCGVGSMPAWSRMFHMAEAAILWPRWVSSPWMRRWPHSGFSAACARPGL
jgi:hypothetical protein